MKLRTEKGDIEVELKPVFAREVDKGFEMFKAMEKVEENKQIEALDTYLKYVNKLTLDKSGLTETQMGDLVAEDRDKLMAYCHIAIEGKVDFMRSSRNAPSTAPQETKE